MSSIIKEKDNSNTLELSNEVMSEEEMEYYRIYLRRECTDWLYNFIMNRYNNKGFWDPTTPISTIFKFSAPEKIGFKTPYYSQICISGLDCNQIKLVYERPEGHSMNDWYFPIYYMLNGKTRNLKRTFDKIGIIPVIDRIQSALPDKYVRIHYRRGIEFDYNIIAIHEASIKQLVVPIKQTTTETITEEIH
jgi:hypothetical protein